MPANYLDLRDTPIQLSASNPSFVLPTFDAPGVVDNPRPVLIYKINPSTLPAEIEFTINGAVVPAVAFQTSPSRAWLEVLNEGDVQPENNVLVITRQSGDFDISDIVLLYPS